MRYRWGKQFFGKDQIEKTVKFGFQVKQDALQKKQNFMRLNLTEMLKGLITDYLEKNKGRINSLNQCRIVISFLLHGYEFILPVQLCWSATIWLFLHSTWFYSFFFFDTPLALRLPFSRNKHFPVITTLVLLTLTTRLKEFSSVSSFGYHFFHCYPMLSFVTFGIFQPSLPTFLTSVFSVEL